MLGCALMLLLGGATQAQDRAWVQIEARPSLAEAEDRARSYAARLGDVEGYRLPSGWYAIALGPYSEADASAVLVNLRRQGAVPGDSFVSDGRGFGRQFWPVGGALGTPAPTVPQQPQLALAAPIGETVAEARTAERRLSRAEREDVQRALEWDGHYRAGIDGSFGPGTRRAMEAWQIASGYPATGVLTTAQRRELLDRFQRDIGSLGLTPVRDDEAGIEITLPGAQVSFDRIEPPFVHYTGEGTAKVLLISQSGSEATLAALYEIMQTLDIVPLDGPRELRRRDFTLTGQDGEIVSHSYATLRDGAIKGFTLIWPVGDERRRLNVLSEMEASFRPLPDRVLPGAEGALDPTLRRNLLSGLDIRKPDRSRSGFFIDAGGAVLTTSEAVASCARVTLDDGVDMKVAAADGGAGLALLQPVGKLAPIGVASFDTGAINGRSEIAVAGYSYDGLLGAPSLTYGVFAEPGGPGGGAGTKRLALEATKGDEGGPVLDLRGAVRGVLLPRSDGPRQLPEEVRFAADAMAAATFLSDNGVSPRATNGGEPLDPLSLSRLAADMTVLVRCWN